LKIYYYTLCWGSDYFNSLFKISLKSFFSKKFTAKKNSHVLFIYTNLTLSDLNKKFKKNIINLKNKKIIIKIVNYKKNIDNKKTNNWRFLGNFQKIALLHAKKNNAKCCFIYPDEVHSENLANLIIKKIKSYELIMLPSNEIFKKDFSSFAQTKLSEKNMLNLKYKNIEKINKKDFFNYNFYCSPQSRFYFKGKGVIYYKSIHLAPIIINPNYIKDVKNIYTLDGYLNDQKNSYVINPDEGLLLSLESNQDNTRDHKMTNNLFLLFLFRVISHFEFNIKNINGINPFFYLKTFTIGTKNKKNFSLKKFLFFDLFSVVIFTIAYVLKKSYAIKKYLKL